MSKAVDIVSKLLEATDNWTIFRQAMAQATQEILAQPGAVYGGGRPDARPVADAYDINCGLCEEWGERVRQLYQEATGQDDVEVLDPGNLSGNADDALAGHVFLRFNGKFYDAECQDGVLHVSHLPLFKKQMGEAAPLDPLAPNPNDDPEMAKIRKRVARFKAQREVAQQAATNPEILALDDPELMLRSEVDKRSGVKKIEIHGKRWYRRGAGGVYCVADIYVNDKLVHSTPEQYGYGDHYLTLATDWLVRNGYVDLQRNEPLWKLRDEKKIELSYYATDVPRERDLFR